eukprot:TRINITY_DN9905_c0_g1_i1.p3 TRINITY_DN9905_c0_g1~~TRINITY_DN9905_c0_g1_i1.p3  ORF type:complete len:153 (-),score=12.23 TRINITY_DN9905_c0_g1_i1:286-744(-)
MEQRLGDNFLPLLERSVMRPEYRDILSRSQACAQTDAADVGSTAELDAVLGEYVIVSKQDAVDAMASYLAAWLATVPEAQQMDPKKLQEALLSSIQELKRSKMKQMLLWGKYAYRGAAFAYSALCVYENPWLVRAIVSATWSAGHVLWTLLL